MDFVTISQGHANCFPVSSFVLSKVAVASTNKYVRDNDLLM